ncbi:hypothetical protein [Spirillospora sp. CA-294931]|uniref:hypothetical protein n=1 Tax=Spirillospora sp. CA-294931 TaxID=3240042 RepID=UPI003D922616
MKRQKRGADRVVAGRRPRPAEAFAQAQERLARARDVEQEAGAAYDAHRAMAPTARGTDRAREVWTQALLDWALARVELEQARDELNAADRRAPEGPDDA